MNSPLIRLARPGDERGTYDVCLKTGDNGQDGERLYERDPDALGRVFVGPYLAFEPELSLVLEDDHGICGYALAAQDSRRFYDRYEADWRPKLCVQFPEPQGGAADWTPVQHVHYAYHHPTYFCPEPYDLFSSHVHIDLLPRVQGRGYGRRMMEQLITALAERGSPGAHLGVGALNTRAIGFYQRLGFEVLLRVELFLADVAENAEIHSESHKRRRRRARHAAARHPRRERPYRRGRHRVRTVRRRPAHDRAGLGAAGPRRRCGRPRSGERTARMPG